MLLWIVLVPEAGVARFCTLCLLFLVPMAASLTITPCQLVLVWAMRASCWHAVSSLCLSGNPAQCWQGRDKLCSLFGMPVCP